MTYLERLNSKVRSLTAVDLGLVDAELDLDEIDFERISSETDFEEDSIESWLIGIRRKKQAIFYGPPGTGKTYTAGKIAEEIVDGTGGMVDTVQFHQGYEYEDFIQGIRPSTDGSRLTYSLEDGSFKKFCEEARNRIGPCVLIIDEINRADVSSVFGELMYLLEYRDENVRLAQDGAEADEDYEDVEGFEIPGNVYIIGTMNTADRSIALVDFALRRRFAFLGLEPDWTVLRRNFTASGVDADTLVEVLDDVNEEIGNQNYEVGHTYFIGDSVQRRADVRNVWELEIVPYLEEYFVDQQDKVEQFEWDSITDSASYGL